MDIRQRQTAFKVRISDLINGNYVVQDGWEPNYIISNGRKVSRANMMGVVVSKQSNELGGNETLVLDDSSGRISARAFEEMHFSNVKVGDIVLLIGRPREYNGEIYIVPEIVKTVEDKRWINVRNIELGAISQNKTEDIAIENAPLGKNSSENLYKNYEVNTNLVEEQVAQEEASPAEKMIKFIRDLDSGDGADFGEVIKNSEGNAEKIINDLLKNGDIFELRPGRLKVLE